MSRSYQLTAEAREQRRQAAKDRWAAMSKEERSEALKPAYSVTPGNPKGRPRKKRRHVLRDSVTGKFTKAA